MPTSAAIATSTRPAGRDQTLRAGDRGGPVRTGSESPFVTGPATATWDIAGKVSAA